MSSLKKEIEVVCVKVVVHLQNRQQKEEFKATTASGYMNQTAVEITSCLNKKGI